MENILKFKIIDNTEVKELSKDTKEIFYFVASKEVVDRDGDVVIVDGIDLSNYEKNPVILFGHNTRDLVIGKAIELKKTKDTLYVGVKFAETEKAKEIKYLVENGFMNAVSIGFKVKEVYDKNGYFGKSFEDLKVDYPDIAKRIDLDKAMRVFVKTELLEISVVPVPANQEALTVFRNKGLDKYCEINEGKIIVKSLDIIENKDVVEKNAVSISVHPKNTKLDDKSSWDKTEAIKTLKIWASSDGSGNKDTIDWNKFKKGFAWYDANAIDNFTSYRYPHHKVVNGDFYTVWRGVATAMAFFMAFRNNLPADDRKDVYKHLVYHYNEFGKKPPEYKKEYDIDYVINNCDEDTAKAYLEFVDKSELFNYIKLINNKNSDVNRLEEHLKSIKEEIFKLSDLVNNSLVSSCEKDEVSSKVNLEDKEKSSTSPSDVNSEADKKFNDVEDGKKSSESIFVVGDEKVSQEEIKDIIKSIILKNIGGK